MLQKEINQTYTVNLRKCILIKLFNGSMKMIIQDIYNAFMSTNSNILEIYQ